MFSSEATEGQYLLAPGIFHQLFALLLVPQMLEGRCTSLVALVRFLACLVQSQLLKGVTTCHVLMNYMLAGFLARYCYEGVWTRDLWISVLIGSSRRNGISRPNYYFTTCSSLVRAQLHSLVAKVQFPASLVQSYPLQGETWSCCFHLFMNYILIIYRR